MTDERTRPQAVREERLRAALRENLKRRKLQARRRGQAKPVAGTGGRSADAKKDV
jgi:hypothetical protein